MSVRARIQQVLREPLVHFLLIGAALFATFSLRDDTSVRRPDTIVVDASRVERLSSGFARTWMRPPTARELEGLIDEYVIEEILYREGLALGLDRDDTVVRRRIRQKMDFLNEDLTEPGQATDAELRAFYDERIDQFREPARMNLEQIYVNAEERGADAGSDAEALLARLHSASNDSSLWGDRSLLPRTLDDVTLAEIAASFGNEFATSLEAIVDEGWTGPIRSSYGLHLVRVSDRVAGHVPSFDKVRNRVEREWTAWRRAEATQAFHDALRARYDISVEMPVGGSNNQLSASAP